ncbi:hypothetical protein HY224_03455, partial [Candidatus Uhrbacteria bacterium]|nr:hypothetical protein [Candidatus Uhrbacteria bacterium]
SGDQGQQNNLLPLLTPSFVNPSSGDTLKEFLFTIVDCACQGGAIQCDSGVNVTTGVNRCVNGRLIPI